MDPRDRHEAEAWPDGRDAGAEWTLVMDKLVFLFQRKDGLTRQEFCDHYLDVHAPLGQRLTVTMGGYTVNLVESEGTVDAITEVWTASMADFFDPAKSFATADDAATLMADHDSFIGPYDAYAVEERVVRGGLPDGPIGARTAGVKRVSLYRDADSIPDPPAGASRVARPTGAAGDHSRRAAAGADPFGVGGRRRRSRPAGRRRLRGGRVPPAGARGMSASITPERYGPWAIVAGASEGIGAAFSHRLAAQGINVVLLARREGPLAALDGELHDRYDVETMVVPLDLSVPGAEGALFDATAALEVGLLVYNAGADEHGAYFLDVDPEEWAAMVRRNCVVPMLAAHHYGGRMATRGAGGVLLVTSGAAWAGGARLATYGATKAFDLAAGRVVVGRVARPRRRRVVVGGRRHRDARAPAPARRTGHDRRRPRRSRRRGPGRSRAPRRRADVVDGRSRRWWAVDARRAGAPRRGAGDERGERHDLRSACLIDSPHCLTWAPCWNPRSWPKGW